VASREDCPKKLVSQRSWERRIESENLFDSNRSIVVEVSLFLNHVLNCDRVAIAVRLTKLGPKGTKAPPS